MADEKFDLESANDFFEPHCKHTTLGLLFKARLAAQDFRANGATVQQGDLNIAFAAITLEIQRFKRFRAERAWGVVVGKCCTFIKSLGPRRRRLQHSAGLLPADV